MTEARPRPLRIALFGHPVGHSRSREIFEGVEDAGGPPVSYEPVDVAPERLEETITLLRHGHWDGANVTIPHKTAVTVLVDLLDVSADRARAANVLYRGDNGTLMAANTDGEGFIRSLASFRDPRLEPADLVDQPVLVLGAGGAARGVCVSLRDAGARCVLVSRQPDRRLSWCPGLARDVLAWDDRERLARATAEARLIVQATPLGMSPDESSCPDLPFEKLGPGQFVVDLVYRPERTLFLERAARTGAAVLNGWPMLVHQAAAALELWAGPGTGSAVIRSAGLA